MRQKYYFNKWLRGFSLVEVLIALTISLFIIAFLFQLLIANQRSLKTQLDLFKLEKKMARVTNVFRAEIRRAGGNIKVVSANHIIFSYQDAAGQSINHAYVVEGGAFKRIDNNGHHVTLIEGVRQMRVIIKNKGLDVEVSCYIGKMEKTIHVFTSIL